MVDFCIFSKIPLPHHTHQYAIFTQILTKDLPRLALNTSLKSSSISLVEFYELSPLSPSPKSRRLIQNAIFFQFFTQQQQHTLLALRLSLWNFWFSRLPHSSIHPSFAFLPSFKKHSFFGEIVDFSIFSQKFAFSLNNSPFPFDLFSIFSKIPKSAIFAHISKKDVLIKFSSSFKLVELYDFPFISRPSSNIKIIKNWLKCAFFPLFDFFDFHEHLRHMHTHPHTDDDGESGQSAVFTAFFEFSSKYRKSPTPPSFLRTMAERIDKKEESGNKRRKFTLFNSQLSAFLAILYIMSPTPSPQQSPDLRIVRYFCLR